MTPHIPTLAASDLSLNDDHAAVLSALTSYAPIGLRELDAVSLQKRMDTKFLVSFADLVAILGDIRSEYAALELERHRNFPYISCYYDTPDFMFYHHHHNGRPNRLKIRLRNYVLSNLFYFEVKQKKYGLRTEKMRLKRSNFSTDLFPNEVALVSEKFRLKEEIKPQLITMFNRFTLAGLQHEERITIDTDLIFDRNGHKIHLDNVVIIEVKQPRSSLQSPIRQALRRLGATPKPFSKYAIGMAFTLPELKTNAFKPIFLSLKHFKP